MQTHRDLIDVAVTDMTEKFCELLGVPCTPDVLAHWQTREAQEALAVLRPQLQLLGARALTIAATPVALTKAQITDKGTSSFLRAALNRVSPEASSAPNGSNKSEPKP